MSMSMSTSMMMTMVAMQARPPPPTPLSMSGPSGTTSVLQQARGSRESKRAMRTTFAPLVPLVLYLIQLLLFYVCMCYVVVSVSPVVLWLCTFICVSRGVFSHLGDVHVMCNGWCGVVYVLLMCEYCFKWVVVIVMNVIYLF